MSGESRFCGQCGAAMTGQFCGSCGASAGAASGADDVQDAPTRMVSGDEPTSNRVPAPGPASSAETGWYESADASASQAPYAGYDSAPYASDAYGQVGHGASAYTSGYPVAPQPERRSTPTALLAAGLVSLLVLVCLGGYLLMRGGDDKQAAPQQSVLPQPTSSQPSPSSSASSSTTAPPAPTSQPTTTETATATATATVTSTAPSTQGGADLSSLPGVRRTATVNGVSYALAQSGRSAQIYSADDGQVTKVADIPLVDDPDYTTKSDSLELVSLPGCSKPVMTFNSTSVGSASYGWNGSEYKAFKSLGGSDLEPVADTNETTKLGTYGVYVEGGKIIYNDEPGKPRHAFSSCSKSSPDVLRLDK